MTASWNFLLRYKHYADFNTIYKHLTLFTGYRQSLTSPGTTRRPSKRIWKMNNSDNSWKRVTSESPESLFIVRVTSLEEPDLGCRRTPHGRGRIPGKIHAAACLRFTWRNYVCSHFSTCNAKYPGEIKRSIVKRWYLGHWGLFGLEQKVFGNLI